MTNTYKLKKPYFVISIDFEKMWGVFDKRSIKSYGSNIENVDSVVVRTLDLFKKYDIHATWATVGFLFFKDLKSLKENSQSDPPRYNDDKFSSYFHLKTIDSKDFNCYYSGLESIKKISTTLNQEIATHTFSHFYCLENGISNDDFEIDLKKALNISNQHGIIVKSIVFPRNQYDQNFLKICGKNNIIAYRGTENSWAQKSRSQSNLNIFHRIIRFVDSYINTSGNNVYSEIKSDSPGLTNIPASFFFRPFNPKMRFLEFLKIRRFKNAMLIAAKQHSLFHLWWHPHNFGKNMDENFIQLETILKYYSELNQEFGMVSRTMEELAFECNGEE